MYVCTKTVSLFLGSGLFEAASGTEDLAKELQELDVSDVQPATLTRVPVQGRGLSSLARQP